MMAFALDKPSQVTGLRRAIHELCVGISAQKCMEEMQKAMLSHMCRVFVSRIVLEGIGHGIAENAGTKYAQGGIVSS